MFRFLPIVLLLASCSTAPTIDPADIDTLIHMEAIQGNADAQFFLGMRYEVGMGVLKDEAMAVSWYRDAANQGHAGSQSKLCVKHIFDEGVPLDETIFWCRRAAYQGDDDAQSMLGAMYSIGRGVPKDYIQAYAWLSLAVVQGDENAQKLKGVLTGQMTQDQIVEAQELLHEYWESYGPNAGE